MPIKRRLTPSDRQVPDMAGPAINALGGAGPAGPPAPAAPNPSFMTALLALTQAHPQAAGTSGINAQGGAGNYNTTGGTDFTAPAAPAPVPVSAPTTAQIIAQAVLQAVGPAPTAVTPDSAGAAPTLADYYDPTPYTGASSAVTAGAGTAGQSINNAYAQALQQSNAQGATAQGQANQYVTQALRQAAQATSAEHAQIATAEQGGTAGSLLNDQLQGQQATLDNNNARGGQVAQAIAQLVGANNSRYSQAISASHANASQALASAVQGELSKIGLAQASAQDTGQKDYASALNAYNTNQANDANDAAKTNSANDTAYATSYDNALKEMQSTASSLDSTGQQTVEGEINSGQLADGTPISSNTAAAWNTAVHGGQQPNGTTLEASPDAPSAIARINANAAGIQASGVNVNALIGLVQQYYQTAKVAPTAAQLQQYLATMGSS